MTSTGSTGSTGSTDDTAQRKIVPETLERRVLSAFSDSTSLFRKTSCAVSYAHRIPTAFGF